MRIIIAGGSGFLGRALTDACRHDGHDVQVLTRQPRGTGDIEWSGRGAGAWTTALEHSDAVVNLAGEGIADSPWTEARKRVILNSRVAATRVLAAAIRGCAHPPRIFLSGSGVGFYGTRTGGPVTEESPPGADFLADVCQAWENETRAAAGVARIVRLRTGLVLARKGGALPRIAMPFRFFVGGRLGSGRQYMSWIHLTDWVGMVRWALASDQVAGPLNVTAPSPATNTEFTRELAAAMHRPGLLPVPATALRTIVGREMADSMLLAGQQALPAKAQQLGYHFRFVDVGSALRHIFQGAETENAHGS